jgi:hypothetical protein
MRSVPDARPARSGKGIPSAGADGRPSAREPADPSRYFGNLDLDFGLLDWVDDMNGYRDGEYGPSNYGHDVLGSYEAAGINYGVCSYMKRARLVAWINGDY